MSAAPVNLSREVKLILVLLGMVALIGGWFLMSRKNTEVTQPPVVAGNTAPNANSSTGTGNTATGNTGAASNVTSGGKVDVAVAPPLPVTNGSTADEATAAPTPGGINPDQPLISLGSINPFRPIKLDPVDRSANAGATQANTNTAPDTAVAGPITISRPSSSNSQINSALASGSVGGAIPLPSIAGTSRGANTNAASTSKSPAATTNHSSVGAFPLPTIAGTKTNTPTTTLTVPKGHGAKPGTPELAPAPKPVVPPVLGMSVPKVNTVPAASSSAAKAPANQAGAQAAAQAATGTTVATPTNPQVVTETARTAVNTPDVSVPATPASSTTTPVATPAVVVQTPLEIALQEHQLAFNAVVLGPVNTAIFRSDKGFVVTSVGQTIPDTKMVLKEVTATSVTLSLGNETKTLQLDKR